jgi:ATP-dependent exoDNAse (exonuclease V) alpha subunit
MHKTLHQFIEKYGDDYKYILWQNKHVDYYNRLVQKQKFGKADLSNCFYKDDKVIFTRTIKDISNAITGVVKNTTPNFVIQWEDGSVYNASKPPFGLKLAYCITVHKSQGSEYEKVCIPCFEMDRMIGCLDKRWLYTAVTRGKKVIRVISIDKSLTKFIKTNADSVVTSDIHY